ncbi:glycosyltransferase, partial [bacterium]|nr:glycosyltransferase [bacterium]
MLQVINDTGIGIGGGENNILTLAKHMSKVGFDLICTCRQGGEFEKALNENGIESFPINLSRKGNLSVAWAMAGFCRTNKIDIVHAHGATGALVARMAFLIPGGIRPITTYHIAITNITDIPFWEKKLFALFDRSMSVVDKKILSVSEAVKEKMVREAFFSRDRIRVLHSGVDLSRFTNCQSGKIRRELCLSDKAIVIGIVARLSEEKGIGSLLETMPDVLKRYPNLHLLIAGDGPIKSELQDLSIRIGLEQNVIFLGYRNDIAEFMTDLDLLVMPSLTEGFPLTLLEGMAAGLPIVATRVGGIPEIITDGREGILVPPREPDALAKAIIIVLRGKEKGKTMGLAARKKVEQEFSVEKMVA